MQLNQNNNKLSKLQITYKKNNAEMLQRSEQQNVKRNKKTTNFVVYKHCQSDLSVCALEAFLF